MIYINGSPLNVTLFPDNTSQVWQIPQLKIPDTNWVHITWDFSHEGEIMQLVQLKHLLDFTHFQSTLRIKYLPYGRQDKYTNNHSTFALRPFALLLNWLHFNEVIIHDPHSQVAIDLIQNVKVQYPKNTLKTVLLDTTTTLACYPDKGAVSKYIKVYEEEVGSVFIYGEKVRDQNTGKILNYELIGSHRASGNSVLIIDDICDGGATFVLLAKALYEAGAKEVNLFVTHGLFTKGLKPLFDAGIKRIYTQDGECSEDRDGHILYRKI